MNSPRWGQTLQQTTLYLRLSPFLTYLLTYLHYLLTFWKKKSAISGICRDISEILTDSESAFKTGQFEHLKTFVAWILGTRTLFLLTQFSKLTPSFWFCKIHFENIKHLHFPLLSTQLCWFTQRVHWKYLWLQILSKH